MNPISTATTRISSINQSTPTTTDHPDERAPRYRQAFMNLLTLIRSLPQEQYAPVNLDVAAAICTTEGVLPKIADMRPIIVQLLPLFPIELFDQLEARALALGHAQTVYESTHHPPPALQPLAAEGSKAHAIALSEVTTQVMRGLIPATALSSLNGGNGYRNLAADLFKLSEVMQSNWEAISNRTTMTQAELSHMENIADQIYQALGMREQMHELQASAGRDRQAAYTLFIVAYGEVRTAIAYVRRKEGDVDTIMPSLYAGRNGGMKKKPAANEPTKPAPAGPAADNHDSLVVTPAPASAEHATAEVNTEAQATKPEPASALTNGPFMR